MSYEKTTWTQGVTTLGPTNMNKIERGIEDAHKRAEDALDGSRDVGAITFASPVADPTTAIGTATATGGAGLSQGAYLYAYTFATGYVYGDGTIEIVGETLPSATKSVTTTAANKIVNLSSIPNSAAATVVAKRIYRTDVSGSTLKLVATIPASQTTYTDSTPDASLGAVAPSSNTTGSSITTPSLTFTSAQAQGKHELSLQDVMFWMSV